MAKYLLDTNVILRFSNPSDGQHYLATEAVATLLRQGNECYLAAQILIELWVVATRPADVNGLGWSVEQTHDVIEQLLNRFPMAGETSQIFSSRFALVTDNQIKGKAVSPVLSLCEQQIVIHLKQTLSVGSDRSKP